MSPNARLAEATGALFDRAEAERQERLSKAPYPTRSEITVAINRLVLTAEAGALNEDDLNRISSIKGLMG